nr:phosphatidate cytidylyltransferase [Chloroflexota bacterium]
MLKQRILSAIVLIPIVLALSYAGGSYFAALVAVAALRAGYEFYHIMYKGGYQPSYAVGLFVIAILLLNAYYPQWQVWQWGLATAVMLPMVWQILKGSIKDFLPSWALTLAGALYVGGLFAHLIALRNLSNGLGWLLLTFAITWVCDTAAYFAGRFWGKRGFFTQISPHKTQEGAMAGFLAGIVTALVSGRWMGLLGWQSLLLGILLVLGATFGDLAESLIKRQVGVKDSSSLIPGHGGMLDRVDSLLFNGVIMYYFVLWIVYR